MIRPIKPTTNYGSIEEIEHNDNDSLSFDIIKDMISFNSCQDIKNNDIHNNYGNVIFNNSLGSTGLQDYEKEGEKVVVQETKSKKSKGTKKDKKDANFIRSFIDEYGAKHINYIKGIRLDNLAKKIKTIAANRIIRSVEKTVNEIIGKNNENLSFNNFKLKKLRAEVYTKYKKNYNIKLLNNSIKSFLSEKNESNEKMINELLNKCESYPMINYIFNLTLENFINILFFKNTHNLDFFDKNIGSFDDIIDEERLKMENNENIDIPSEEEINEYFNLLQYLAIHLREYYDEKIGRIRNPEKEIVINLNSF